MVTLIRWTGRFVVILLFALYVLGIASSFVFADDANAKARAALAIAVAKQAPPVVGQRPPRTPEQIAKAALAEAMGKECDCGLCDKAKPMPSATPAKEPPKRSIEKLAYAELEKAVGKLKVGESLRVYVGQKAPQTATGRLVELIDTIPGEEQIVGVFRFWVENGEGKYQSHHPDDKPAKVVIGGKFYDQYADGSLFWCVECNRGK